MFGIGFTELLLIGVVALIVIGPERLPRVARTVGAWVGRFNRYAAQIKEEIDREMHLDELRDMQQSVKESVQKYEIMAEEATQQVKKESEEFKKSVQEAADMVAADPNAPSADPEQTDESGQFTEALEISEAEQAAEPEQAVESGKISEVGQTAETDKIAEVKQAAETSPSEPTDDGKQVP